MKIKQLKCFKRKIYALLLGCGLVFLQISTASGCENNNIEISKRGGKQIVSFGSFFPVRLSTNSRCDPLQTCSYDLMIMNGNNFSKQFEDLNLTDLCNSKTEEIGKFRKIKRSVRSIHPLDDIYQYSRTSSLKLELDQGSIILARIDYAGLEPEISWIEPLVEKGSAFTAGIAASRFQVTVVKD